MYGIRVIIPCEREELVSIWWKFCRLGYRLEYKDAQAYIYGLNKTVEDIADLEAVLEEYPERKFSAISQEDGGGWSYAKVK